MNKGKVLKIIISILTIFNLLFVPNISKASFLDDVINQAGEFLNIGEADAETEIDKAKMQDTSSDIYVILLVIAIVVAVIIGGVLGIQFILASAEEKAKVKEALIPYIIGCIVAFGAFGIWKAVVLVFN